MQKYFKLSGYSLTLFTAIILMASCNNGGNEKKGSENSGTDSGKKSSGTEQVQPKKMALIGTLDTLYIDRQAFDTITGNPKLAFSFTFTTADKLTLAGWIYHSVKKSYDSLPNMTLENSNASVSTYDNKTYFGNVVISAADFAKIQKKLMNASMKYVLFAPEKLGNNIKYKVFVSDKSSGFKEVVFVATPTDADLNPSPPKDY